MYSGENKTAIQSQNAIVSALAALMEEKDFAKISISELCKRSRVSRQTFYTWFKTKENIIEYDLDANSPFEPGKESQLLTVPETCRYFAEYVTKNYSFLKQIVDSGLDGILYKSFYNRILKEERLQLCPVSGGRKYIASFLAGGFVGIINTYVENEKMEKEDLEKLTLELLHGDYLKDAPGIDTGSYRNSSY